MKFHVNIVEKKLQYLVLADYKQEKKPTRSFIFKSLYKI